jgi:hypothetical protein
MNQLVNQPYMVSPEDAQRYSYENMMQAIQNRPAPQIPQQQTPQGPQIQQAPELPQGLGIGRQNQYLNMIRKMQQATDPVQQQRIRERMDFLQNTGAGQRRPTETIPVGPMQPGQQMRPNQNPPIMPAGQAQQRPLPAVAGSNTMRPAGGAPMGAGARPMIRRPLRVR